MRDNEIVGMETAGFSQASVSSYKTIQYHNREYHNVSNNWLENLKIYISASFVCISHVYKSEYFRCIDIYLSLITACVDWLFVAIAINWDQEPVYAEGSNHIL
jgi:hypothetical protein